MQRAAWLKRMLAAIAAHALPLPPGAVNTMRSNFSLDDLMSSPVPTTLYIIFAPTRSGKSAPLAFLLPRPWFGTYPRIINDPNTERPTINRFDGANGR